MSGPVPKRDAERRRRNKRETETVAVEEATVEPYEPSSEWHPVALQWYLSLMESVQSRFYEPSDWGTAYVIAETISRELLPQPVVVAGQGVEYVVKPPTAAAVSALLRACGSLMVTEGDRRRLRVEIERGGGAEPEPGVADLDEYRRNLASGN